MPNYSFNRTPYMKINSILRMAHSVAMFPLAASLAVLFAIGPARETAASILAYEGFNYVANQPLATMSGGFGWAPGPWTQLSGGMVDQPPTLINPAALPPTGDSLLTQVAGAASRNFLAPLNNSGGDLWISFLDVNATGGLPGTFVDIQQTSAALPDIEVGKAVGNAITLNGLPAGSVTGLGADLFILQLVQWSAAGTLVNLYVDPGLILGPPNASVLISGPAFQAQDFYYQSNPGQELDEIRVGTTVSDVSLVPEPSAFTLFASALLLLPLARRNAKRTFSSAANHRSSSLLRFRLPVLLFLPPFRLSALNRTINPRKTILSQ